MPSPVIVTLNGVKLNDYCSIVSIDTGIIPPRKNSIISNDVSHGAKYLRHQYEPKPIPVRINIPSKNLAATKRLLASVISANEAIKFKCSNEPDKYYLVYLEGDTNVERMTWRSPTTLHFYAYDPPFALSEIITPFAARTNSENVLELLIQNNGTAPVPVDYEITMNADNGYIGIVSEHGVMEFGKRDEVDGEDYKANEQLIATTDFADWKTGTENHENPAKICNMELGVRKDAFGSALGDIKGEMQNTGGWSGGLRYIDVPADSEGHVGAKNFYVWARYWFETGKMGQTGTSSINLIAKDGSLICSYILEKIDSSGNTGKLLMRTGGPNSKIYKTFPFQPTHWKKNNPYTWEKGGGPLDIRKEGEKITMYYWGGYHSISVPELADVECARVEYYAGQYNGRNLTNQRVDFMHLRYLSFDKLNVEKWRDTPNRYSRGDVLTIDGKTKKPYYNGMLRLDDEIIGSSYFSVPPGETKIQIHCSDFSNPKPTVKAYLREAYL